MPVKLHEGDLGHLSGNILASWFIVNPRGPTAFAVGYKGTAARSNCAWITTFRHTLWAIPHRPGLRNCP